MQFFSKTTRLSASAALLGLGLTLVACGGGGGGGTSYPNIQYTGSTNQAAVSDTNSEDISLNMLEGSNSADAINPLGAVQQNSGSNATTSQHTAMLSLIAKQVSKDISNKLSQQKDGAISGVTQVLNGSCGGNLTINDSSTQTSLNGSITAANYCDGGLGSYGYETEMHGVMNYSGSLYLSGNTPVFQSMTLNISYIKITYRTNAETYSEEYSGNLTISFDGTISNDLVSVSNVTVNYESNTQVYKIQNLDISAAGSISGRFYHPSYGYVDITTTSTFTFIEGDPSNEGDDQYCDGVLELVGTTDTIEFAANASCTQYEVCVKPTGDPSCLTGTAWVNWP